MYESKKTKRKRSQLTVEPPFVSGGRGQNHDGDPDGRGQHPVVHVDNLGIARRPEVQCFDRVAHGNVAVDTHSGEREDTGEHVVVVYGHDDLAQDVPKRPGSHQVVDALEGECTRDQGICQGQVKYVDIGGCFHLGVSGLWKERGKKGQRERERGGEIQ